jgi:hypothetical protein
MAHGAETCTVVDALFIVLGLWPVGAVVLSTISPPNALLLYVPLIM